MWRRNVTTIVVGSLLVLLLLAYMSTYQVRFNEVAIVKTFGQVTHVQRESGLGLRWPWPIQQVVKYDLRVNVLEDPLSETLTRGGKPVVAQAYMAWRIKEPEQFLTKIASVGRATRQLRNILKEKKEAVLGQYTLANFVSTDSAQRKIDDFERQLHQIVGDVAQSQYGVEVLAVGLKRLGVPQSTSEEIFAAMNQGREELATKYRSEGNAEAESIVSRAEETRNKVLSFAQFRAEQLRAEGYAAAADKYKVFQEDEQFAIFLKELGVLRQTLGANTTIVLDWTLRPFGFFQTGPSLPGESPQLDQLQLPSSGGGSPAAEHRV